MEPNIYTVEFEGQTIAAASGDVDLFEIAPADDRPVVILGLTLATTSELAEAQEEWLRLRIIRGHATTGNGSATTPRPLNPNVAAAGFAAETLGTTIASAGTGVNLLSDAMQVRNGYSIGPLPLGFGFGCTQAQTLIVVRLMAAVADDVTASGTLWVGEW
jgi:hypothetical protein